MQTPTLPIQVNTSSPSPAPQRANANANAEAAPFSQTLNREIEQRQNTEAPPAKAAAPQDKPKAADKTADKTDKADEGASAKPADEASDDAADASAATPVADLIAMVANFITPAPKAPAASAAPVATDAVASTPALPAAAAPELPPVAATLPADADAAGEQATPREDGKDFKLDLKAAVSAPKDDKEAPALPALPELKQLAKPDAKPLPAEASPKAVAASGKPQLAPIDATQPAAPKEAPAAAVQAKVQPDAAPVAAARKESLDIAAVREASAPAPSAPAVQQAAVAAAPLAMPAATDKIAARVGTPGWDNQVGQKIVWMVAGKEQSASLTLNPPDLGPMQVVLNVTNDHASVTFTAAQPEVRQALENALPRLREMMSDNGIALGNATVNAGSSQQGQQASTEQGNGQRGGNGLGRFDSGPIGSAEPVTARPARPASRLGAVDTFA